MPGNDAAAQDALAQFLEQYPDVEVFEAIVPDLGGRLRGKWVERDRIGKAFDGGLKLPLSTLALDAWGRDPAGWVFGSGDVDGICVPEPSTLAGVPWLDRPTAQVLMSIRQTSGGSVAYDPRSILAGQVAALAARGLTAVVAVEIEFHLFSGIGDDGRPLHTQSGPEGRAPIGGQTYGIDAMRDAAPFMHDVRDAASAQGLPVDTLIAEAGASQFEVNLHHQADALRAADQAVMLERLLKGVAAKHGLRATFMAKPFADEPGNGMHVHVSLMDDAGNNVFDDGGDAGSDVLSHAIAGCLGSLPDCMLVFAPNRNSYRRFARDSHAPVAPCWGYDNRTVAVRVPAGAGDSRRIEHRLPGADAGVHLVVASILAGIVEGIDAANPAPLPIAGNAYEQCPASLPLTWTDALAAFRGSNFVARHFGESLREVYAGVRQQEVEEFERFISPLEYHTYL